MANRDRMTFRSVMVGFINHDRDGVNLADALFKLARSCVDVAEFLNNCKVQEDWAVSPEATQMRVSDIPRAWIQAKSNIKRGMERGLDPNDYPSLSKFRAAKASVGKATGTETQDKLKGKAGKDKPELREASDVSVPERDTGGRGPSDMADIMELIAPLNQLSRARCIKEMTVVAQKHRDNHDANAKEGQRRKSREPASLANGRVVDVA